MAGISFMGSYSGIDRSTIDQLMQVERLPLNQYTTRKASITEQQNAWKDINTRLNSLFGRIGDLKSSDTFTSMKSTSTNEEVVRASASNNAAEGVYKINVSQLATSISIIGGVIQDGTFDDQGKFNTAGSFTIKNEEGIEHIIEYTEVDDLRSLVEKINAGTKDIVDSETKEVTKGTGITASIIDGRLVLTDEKTGDRKIELTAENNDTLDSLGLASNVEEVKGQNAKFTINGVEVERSSNSISDVVDGLTINLRKQHETGQYDTVSVGIDDEKAETAVKAFVDQYNSTMKFIEEKLAAGDPEVPGSAGTLSGDGSLMRLHSSLRNLVTSRVSAEEGGFSDISQLGISTKDRFGELQFDATKFKEALAEDQDKVMNFFFAKDDKDNEVGFVSRVNGYIDSFISKENGILKSKNETYDKTLKDINKQIETFEARMVKKEEQLIAKFTALDVAMMQAESQMTWLQGQVDAMNGIKR